MFTKKKQHLKYNKNKELCKNLSKNNNNNLQNNNQGFKNKDLTGI